MKLKEIKFPFVAVEDDIACCIAQHRNRSEVPLEFGVMQSETSVCEVQRGPVLILVDKKPPLEQPSFLITKPFQVRHDVMKTRIIHEITLIFSSSRFRRVLAFI